MPVGLRMWNSKESTLRLQTLKETLATPFHRVNPVSAIAQMATKPTAAKSREKEGGAFMHTLF